MVLTSIVGADGKDITGAGETAWRRRHSWHGLFLQRLHQDALQAAHILFDEYSEEDNIIPALSDQAHAPELSSRKFVLIVDTSQGQPRTFFGQIVRGPVHIPEWGSTKDGVNIFPIVSGDKVEYVPSFHGYVKVKILGEVTNGGRLENTFARPYPKSRICYPNKDWLERLLGLPQAGGLLGVLANYKDEDIIVDMTDEIVRKQLGILAQPVWGKRLLQ